MKPERDAEYNELLSYIVLLAIVVWQIDPASANHPAKAIEEIVQKFL